MQDRDGLVETRESIFASTLLGCLCGWRTESMQPLMDVYAGFAHGYTNPNFLSLAHLVFLESVTWQLVECAIERCYLTLYRSTLSLLPSR